MTIDDIPRIAAQTRRFTLGRPRAFTVTPDGAHVIFIRARSATDPVHLLWTIDVTTGEERLVVDPRDLRGDASENLPPEERARRERLGEAGNGITAYTTDDSVTKAVFALGGDPWVVDLNGSTPARRVAAPGPVIDPRLDPTGRRIAYVHAGGLWVSDLDGEPVALLTPESDTVTYGLADFAAAEELDRIRGFWWSPDGNSLLVQRTDEAPVTTWWISEPIDPASQPTPVRYPVAGSANAEVAAVIVTVARDRLDVSWDAQTHEYLARAWWDAHGPVVGVLSRDNRSLRVLAVDAATGATRLLSELAADQWINLVDGLPTRTPDGRLVSHVDDAASDTRLLTIDGVALDAPGLQLDSVIDVSDDGALALVSADPVDTQLVRIGWDGSLEPVLGLPGPAVQFGAGSVAGPVVVTSHELEATGAVSVIVGGPKPLVVPSLAAAYPAEPRVEIFTVGERELRTAVVLPSWWEPGSTPLPIVLAPYGGPGVGRVIAARGAYIIDQWLADQGFAVVICDGSGTPGRGPAFEHEIYHDLVTGILADQLTALDFVVAHFDGVLDDSRVGIHGWSFGGYVAALAILTRPDRFHAAVAGAPVTDYRLYDTAYTERYLGLPQDNAAAYDATDLSRLADRLEGALLIVHGLSDDNVYAAHSLRLSQALLEAGRSHQFLPLSGASHRGLAVSVAENEIRFVGEFFVNHLI